MNEDGNIEDRNMEGGGVVDDELRRAFLLTDLMKNAYNRGVMFQNNL